MSAKFLADQSRVWDRSRDREKRLRDDACLFSCKDRFKRHKINGSVRFVYVLIDDRLDVVYEMCPSSVIIIIMLLRDVLFFYCAVFVRCFAMKREH